MPLEDTTAARHFARMHLHAVRAGLSRNNPRMSFRLIVGSREEREEILAGCIEAHFELAARRRSTNDTTTAPERAQPASDAH